MRGKIGMTTSKAGATDDATGTSHATAIGGIAPGAGVEVSWSDGIGRVGLW